MRLKILGSSSKGNCYLLETKNEVLIIEAGVQFSDVQKAINFQTNKIVGCIVSHEHGDHAGFVHQFSKRGITILGTEKAIHRAQKHNRIVINDFNYYYFGGFTVVPFVLVHDVECYGFRIFHDESGLIVFITDTGQIPYKFGKVDHLLIESNYSESILQERLEAGKTNAATVARLPDAHLSIEKAAKWLKMASDGNYPTTTVLLHLSNGNSNAFSFYSVIQEITQKDVFIARKDLEINLNKYPF